MSPPSHCPPRVAIVLTSHAVDGLGMFLRVVEMEWHMRGVLCAASLTLSVYEIHSHVGGNDLFFAVYHSST